METPTTKTNGSTVYAQFSAMRAADVQREARERRMVNALETLERFSAYTFGSPRSAEVFVRATAREGLGRDAAA